MAAERGAVARAASLEIDVELVRVRRREVNEEPRRRPVAAEPPLMEVPSGRRGDAGVARNRVALPLRQLGAERNGEVYRTASAGTGHSQGRTSRRRPGAGCSRRPLAPCWRPAPRRPRTSWPRRTWWHLRRGSRRASWPRRTSSRRGASWHHWTSWHRVRSSRRRAPCRPRTPRRPRGSCRRRTTRRCRCSMCPGPPTRTTRSWSRPGSEAVVRGRGLTAMREGEREGATRRGHDAPQAQRQEKGPRHSSSPSR